ncbi:MAG: hypothetical protein JSS23_12450 [Proteobacteria bacterium]|nr:hypothetical protein [Pseudomonadota bacterium]
MTDLNILDLGQYMAVPPRTRNFLHILRVGHQIAEAFEHTLPALTQTEQKVLVTVAAFRLQGSLLPADITLLAHCPQLLGVSEGEIMGVVEGLVHNGVLEVSSMVDGEFVDPATVPKSRAADVQVCFSWPALERLVIKALEDANRPRIVVPGAPR